MWRVTLIASFIIIVNYCELQAQVSKVEGKILSAVDERNAEAVALLKEVININSGTMNFDGVRKVSEVFRSKFENMGFETEWVEGADFQRAGHLIARHKGSGTGPKLLLIGHLDTVFEPESEFQEFKMINDSTIMGPGVGDMKGGDVIAIYALQALKDAGLLEKMNIEVIFTGDEEKSGSPVSLARKDLITAAEKADIAIGFENGDSNSATAVVSRRGSTSWELHVTGKPAHSSQVFSEKVGAGAIYETSRILIQFYEKLRGEELLTFNPGVIVGGTQVEFSADQDAGSAHGKTNVVAKEVVVKGDLRTISLEQLDRVKLLMNEIVKNSLPKTQAKLIFSKSGYPPLAPTDGNQRLLALYSQVSKDLGYGSVRAVAPINAGAADISFTSGLVDMAIDGIGLSGGDDHTVNEFGELNMLSPLTKRAAIFMYRLHKTETDKYK